MKSLQVTLPTDIGSEFEALGLTDESRIAEWVADAVRRKLSAEKQVKLLEERASRGDRDAFRRVLSKVPPAEPAIEDRLPNG